MGKKLNPQWYLILMLYGQTSQKSIQIQSLKHLSPKSQMFCLLLNNIFYLLNYNRLLFPEASFAYLR